MNKRELARDLFNAVLNLFRRYGWSGHYASWEEARRQATGYDETLILERVTAAAAKVKSGAAAFERDAVAFDQPEYNWPLLACLLFCAQQSNGRLHVIDFGGSLGSTYSQHRPLLLGLPDLRWAVVEQPHFVARGRELFTDPNLAFFPSADACVAAEQPNVLLLSSVLQYLEKPYDMLASLLALRCDYVLVDRTGFVRDGAHDRLTLQRVNPSVYPASYPCWFFVQDTFRRFCEDHGYRLQASFDALDWANIPSIYKGFLFQRSKQRAARQFPGLSSHRPE